MIVAGYGDPADPNKGIDTFKAENSLNVPFRFLDQWADGLKSKEPPWIWLKNISASGQLTDAPKPPRRSQERPGRFRIYGGRI